MNKLLSFVLVILVSASAHAQNSDKAKVYLMRSDGFQAPTAAFTVFNDGQLVTRLPNKRYTTLMVSPGTHTFSGQFSGTKSNDKAEKTKLNVEAGKTYYVKYNFKHGIFMNKLHCTEINDNTAQKMLPELKEVRNSSHKGR